MKRELRAILCRLRDQGWTVELRRSGHYRLDPPGGGGPYFTGSTPSDWRGIRNLVADLRRRGARL